MEEHLSPKFLCKWQRLAYSHFQTKPEAYDCWHPAVFKDIIPKRYDQINMFVEDRSNGKSFLIGRIEGFDSRDSSAHSVNECSSPDVPESLVLSTEVSRNVSDFFLSFFYRSDTVEAENFFFSVTLVIFWHGSFSNAFRWLLGLFFLINGYPLGTRRPSHVVPPDEQSFCWHSAAWNLSFFKPARNKRNTSILLASIRRYLTFSNFNKYK